MRNINRSLLILFLLWMLAGMTVLNAEDSTGLSGALTLPDASTACDGIKVELERPFGIEYRHTLTDWLCNFSFKDLEPDVYFIHVDMPGYIELHQPVHVEETMKSRVAVPLQRGVDRDTDSSPSGSPIVDASEILRLYPEEAVHFYKESLESRKKGKFEE